MSVERFDLNAIAPQPWKNGAGLTREIAYGGASRGDFDWRISVAEIVRDAPFSRFAGVDRCIVLLRGAGMRLHTRDAASIDHSLTTPLAPFCFPGEVALDATLIDDASSDFNVMTRRGVIRSRVRCECSATELDGGDATLLFCCAGAWQLQLHAGDASPPLRPMQALLWRTPVRSLRIEPMAEAAALIVVRLCHDRQP